jgi:hypothetical protein
MILEPRPHRELRFVIGAEGKGGHRLEIDVAGALHFAGDDQQVGRVAREPINGRGYHHVAGGKAFHRLGKLRPVGGGAGDLLAEHLFAPSRLQFGKLAGEVLGVGRAAGIAVNHAVHCASESRPPPRRRSAGLRHRHSLTGAT